MEAWNRLTCWPLCFVPKSSPAPRRTLSAMRKPLTDWPKRAGTIGGGPPSTGVLTAPVVKPRSADWRCATHASSKQLERRETETVGVFDDDDFAFGTAPPADRRRGGDLRLSRTKLFERGCSSAASWP